MVKIGAIRTGGQSGADRASMKFARDQNIKLVGWCPKDGWAEDYPDPPGILDDWPQFAQTPSKEPILRTEWNIRDSNCCLVFNANDGNTSSGTDAGMEFFTKYSISYIYLDLDEKKDVLAEKIRAWLNSLFGDDEKIVLGVGGPRASEYDGVEDIVYEVLELSLIGK